MFFQFGKLELELQQPFQNRNSYQMLLPLNFPMLLNRGFPLVTHFYQQLTCQFGLPPSKIINFCYQPKYITMKHGNQSINHCPRNMCEISSILDLTDLMVIHLVSTQDFPKN